MQSITPFLMFEGKAEEAMNFYMSLFDHSAIVNVTRYGEDAGNMAGKIVHATFSLKGQEFMCIDSSVKHEFSFTPALSLYVTCHSEAEIHRYYDALSNDGAVLMSLDVYPFSELFGWVADKYGVSWQLTLVKGED